MSLLRPLVALLAGDDRSREDEILQARREVDEALAALRIARASWESPHTLDVDALRRALDLAERQLDSARVRLHRALRNER